MAYDSLKQFVNYLDKKGELIRVKHLVSTELEITEIADRFSKLPDGGKAVLFENNGTDFPLLINALGSEKRIKLALNINDLNDPGDEIRMIFQSLVKPKDSFLDKIRTLPKLSKIARFMPKKVSEDGYCQEQIMDTPNLNNLPVLKCWPADGGKFITLPMVFTKSPSTGQRNVGMYRMQIIDEKTTAMHWHRHKTGANHFDEYKRIGERMPIAVVLGGDPAFIYSATAPLPENIDEMMLAGFLRKKKVEMVKCKTVDMEVPSEADFVIEGFIDPNEEFFYEGPFGDHTGYYSLADYYPKFHVTAITYRKDAIYPATIVGVPPMEDAYIGKATERIFLAPIQLTMLPELEDMSLPFMGVAHNLTIVKIDKKYPGHAHKVMNNLWGAGQMMFNKNLLVLDKNVDIQNHREVAKAVSKNYIPARDTLFSKGPLDVLDHAAREFSFGGKLGIDASNKNKAHKKGYDRLKLEKSFSEVSEILESNFDFLKEDISVIICSFEKSKGTHIQYILEKVKNIVLSEEIRMLVFVDSDADIFDTEHLIWIATNNIDPASDCKVFEDVETDNSFLFVDATKKISEQDKFTREWPNIVTMDDVTITKIDSIWKDLNIGEFIVSPSKKMKKLVSGTGAVYGEKL